MDYSGADHCVNKQPLPTAIYLGSAKIIDEAELKIKYHEKIADFSFDAIKFLIRLYVLSVSLYLVFFAGLIALETSPIFEGSVNRTLKVVMVVLTVFIVVYAWATWYLVSRVAKRLRASLTELSPAQEHARLERAQAVFVSVGTVACTAGTLVLVRILIFILRI